MAPTLSRQQRVALHTWTPANLKSLWADYLKKNPGAKLPSTGMAPNVGGFSPFTLPDRPPPGTYDPGIDAQVRAGGRGYGDLQVDTGIQNQRAQDNFTLQTGELQKHLDQALADAATGRGRQHAGYEDALTGLTRQFNQLGNSQSQHAGVASGGFGAAGALQQALDKRMANHAIAQHPLDVNEANQVTDYGTTVDRLNQGFQTDSGQLALGLSRGNEDRSNTLTRAGRENTQLGLDAADQRWYQATQSGYDVPQAPGNEHGTGAKSFRYVNTPRGTRRLLSTGYLIGRH